MNNLMKQLNARRGRHAVLYVGGNALDAQTVRDMFPSNPGRFVVECVETLSEGLERVMASSISAVLLDLRLPDCQGMDALDQLAAANPALPILVVGGDQDEGVAEEVVRRGAYCYLLMCHLDSYWLPRALLHAIERKQAEEALFGEMERAEVTLNSIADAVLSTDLSWLPRRY